MCGETARIKSQSDFFFLLVIIFIDLCSGFIMKAQQLVIYVTVFLLLAFHCCCQGFMDANHDDHKEETCSSLESNCSGRFPSESGIRCSIHHGAVCSSKGIAAKPQEVDNITASSQTTFFTDGDYHPYLRSLNITKFGWIVEGNLTFSFLLRLRDVIQKKIRGIQAQFRTRNANRGLNEHYSQHTICRYFDFDVRNTARAYTVDSEKMVKIRYPCIGTHIFPDDFRLTLTSFPSSHQLVYDVKWAYQFNRPKQGTWVAEVLAVTAVKLKGIVHVVFEPPEAQSGVSGVIVNLMRDETVVQSKHVPLGGMSTFFDNVKTGVYSVELKAYGGRCFEDSACLPVASLPVAVEAPLKPADFLSTFTEVPPRKDNSNVLRIILVTSVVILVVLIIGGFFLICYKRRKGMPCRRSKPYTILFASCSLRPLEIELLISLRKLVEANLTNAHVKDTYPNRDSVSSSRTYSSGENEDFDSLVQQTSSNYNFPDMKKFNIVLFLQFDSIPEKTEEQETASLLSPKRQTDVDFLNRLKLAQLKAKRLIVLPVGDVSEEDGATLGAARFLLPKDKYSALGNVFECLQFLKKRCDPHEPSLDRKEISLTSEWAEFDNLLSRVLETPCYINLQGEGFCSNSRLSEYDLYPSPYLPSQDCNEVVTVIEDGAFSQISYNKKSSILTMDNNYTLMSEVPGSRMQNMLSSVFYTSITDDSSNSISNPQLKDSFSNLSEACRNFKRQWGSQLTFQTTNTVNEPKIVTQQYSVPNSYSYEGTPLAEIQRGSFNQNEDSIPKSFQSAIIPPDCV